MNDEIEKTNNKPNQQTPDIVQNLNEQLDNARIVREILEFHAANQLCVPLYELREKPPDEPSDDTLSRLERLSNPPKKEYHKELVGGIYPLTDEEFLIILKDGTIIKLAHKYKNFKSKNEAKNEDRIRDLYERKEISKENLTEEIKEYPQMALALVDVGIAYRTDDRLLKPEEIGKLVKNDLEKAADFIKAASVEKNRAESLKAIVSSPLNPFSRNEMTDE